MGTMLKEVFVIAFLILLSSTVESQTPTKPIKKVLKIVREIRNQMVTFDEMEEIKNQIVDEIVDEINPTIASSCCEPKPHHCDDGNQGPYCDHPCNRDCTANDHTPMTCHYTFTTRDQYSDEPGRRADGRNRTVLTYNDILPGPLIVVCEGDTVKVHLKNHVKDGPLTNSDGSPNSTTLHFHGIRQVSVGKEFGPFNDGVPFVTQCPVEFKDHFTYTFFAGRYLN